MKVPFFNYKKLYQKDKYIIDKTYKDVMNRGAFILQDDLQKFEKKLAKYCGSKYALGVANGTDALWLVLSAVGLKQNDEILIPSHTYVATPAAAKFIGLKPILVDCNKHHLMSIKDSLSKLTKKTKAIMPVQLNGRTIEMDRLMEFAITEDLIVIEDAAQGLGSMYKDQMSGSFGLAGTFSFYPAKTLGCFGDGGAIVTNNKELYQKLYEMRDHGRNQDGNYKRWGLNSRLDNLQAAILLSKIDLLNDEINRRRAIANMYNDSLLGIEDIFLPPCPKINDIHYDTFQNYEIECENRDKLQNFLINRGINTIVQWGGKAIHQITSLKIKANVPATDELFQKCLLLPMNTTLSDDEVYYVIESIQEFYK
tara:strand:- start:1692 stop:2792 length:1101 start_codon:yes stop_codon:yes gene_type:complete